MLQDAGQSATIVQLIVPASAANTAAATSAWVNVKGYTGDLVFTVSSGAITGTLTGTIEDATDGSGTGGAGITPNEGVFTAISTSNQIQKRTVPAQATRGFVRFVGTIVTGPILVSVSLLGRPSQI